MNEERPLAHIERIISIFPIAGADQIEVAQVLGWYVVVKKGDFAVGDLCVFYEIDSFLNANDPRYSSFEDRFTNWNGKRGMRLKTIKLRGQISQGLALKMSEFPEVAGKQEGDDVTELLKIEKWVSKSEFESNGGNQSKMAGSFPSFIEKTDQIRIQSLLSVIEKFMDEEFEVTIKMDGSSMTVFTVSPLSKFYEDAKFLFTKKPKSFFDKIVYRLKEFWNRKKPRDPISGVCSKNVLLKKDDESHFTLYTEENKFIQRLENLGGSYAVQGELIGPTIQSNYEKVDDYKYLVYDVIDIDQQNYLLPEDVKKYCEIVKLDHVPILHDRITLRQFVGDLTDRTEIVKKLLELAEGPGMNPGVKREGLVFKHLKSNFSFKVVSNSYLLAKEKKSKE